MTDELNSFEDAVLELTERHVRTPEGMKKYNLPIGALITKDAVQWASDHGFSHKVPEDGPHGGKGHAPDGTTPRAPKPSIPGTISAKQQGPKPPAPPKAPPAPKVSLKAKPSIAGNNHFSVGKGKYSAPGGSKLIHPADNPSMAYIVTSDGKVHAFVEGGEINIPSPLDKVLANKFGNDFDGDDQYKVSEFEKVGASHDLPSLPPGTTLTDQRGEPQFKKLGDDSWEHVGLGVKVKDGDLQSLYDSGDLVPDKSSQDVQTAAETFDNKPETNFKDMSHADVVAALDKMPTGQKVTMKVTSKDGESAHVFSKTDSGGWMGENPSPDAPSSPPVSSDSLAYLQDLLTIGAEPKTPHNPLDMHSQPNPLDSNPQKLIGDKPDQNWVNRATPGAQLNFESQTGNHTTWTKSDHPDGHWKNDKGGQLSHAGLLDYMTNSDQGAQNLKIKREGKYSPELYNSRNWEELNKPYTPQIKSEEPTTSKPEETSTDLSTEHLDKLPVGSKVTWHSPSGKSTSDFTKTPDGKWAEDGEDSTSPLSSSQFSPAIAKGLIEVTYQPKTTPPPAPSNAEKDYSTLDHAALEKALAEGEISLKKYEQHAKAFEKLNAKSDTKATESALDAAPPGSEVHIANTAVSLVKQSDGQWKSSGFTGSLFPSSALANSYSGKLTGGEKKEVHFGDPNFYSSAPLNTVVHSTKVGVFNGPVTFGGDGNWHGEDVWGSFSFTPAEMQHFHDEGDIHEHAPEAAAPELKQIHEISTASSLGDIKKILEDARVGAQIHPINSSATLTKSPDGTWKSNVTNADISSHDVASVYAGEPGILQPGPSDSLPEHVERAPKTSTDIKEIDKAESAQQMNDMLFAASVGTQVHVIGTNPPTVYTKQSGWWEHSETGFWASSHELSELNFNESHQMSMLAHGDGQKVEPVKTAEELSIPKPAGLPEGSVEIHNLDSVPVGGHISQVDSEGHEYFITKTGPDEFSTTIKASGFKIPGNTKNDIQAMMDAAAVGEQTSAFWLHPEATNAPKEGESITSAHFENFAPGQVLHAKFDGSLVSYEKQNDGSWFSPEVGTLPEKNLKQLAGGGDLTYAKPNDFPETKVWQQGTKLSGVEDLNAQAVGTKLAYTKLNGKVSHYTKLQGDNYLTPGGQTIGSSGLHSPASKGQIAVHDVPAKAVPDAPSANEKPMYLFMNGDKITEPEHLASFQPGQVLEMKYGSEHLNYVVKQDDGSWKAENDPHWPGLEFSPGDMSDSMKAGSLHYVGSDTPSLSKGEMQSPSTQLWDGAPAVSKEQMAEALKGLDEHSSFHVAYGLKSLPDNNPLKDPVNQGALKEAAMQAHPELKAKPAVQKYLAEKLGIQQKESGNWEDALMESGPKISIGSKDPKKVGVQGMDGGQYTEKDIQGAIDILEGYNGKLFKNELNKKGNPLGELDPTQLVGFDKDKLVTKQKFIDMLKSKLVKTEKPVHDEHVTDFEEFKNFGLGTTVVFNDGKHSSVYTKIGPDAWNVDGGGGEFEPIQDVSFTSAINSHNLTIQSKPDVVPDYAKTPAAVQEKEKLPLNHLDPNFSVQTLQDAPSGTRLEWGDGTQNQIEKKDGLWNIYDAQGNWINSWDSQKLFGVLEMQGKSGDGWHFKESDGPSFNKNSASLILPGKYNAGPSAKAFMIVNADGSGTYTKSTGATQNLTAEEVKANFQSGMSKYVGMPSADEAPKAAPAPDKKSPVVKKPKTAADVPNGNYFNGDPSNPKTSYMEVQGDTAKVFKPATGITSQTGIKVGQSPSKDWALLAGQGAAVHQDQVYVGGEAIWAPDADWTKGNDGLWYGKEVKSGKDLGPFTTDELPSQFFTYYSSHVKAHGLSDPVDVPKAKLSTMFNNGDFVDQYGLPVVPEGHTGSLNFFGAKTTVPSLLKLQSWLDKGENIPSSATGFMTEMQQLGVSVAGTNFAKYRSDKGFENTLSGTIAALKASLKDVLAGVDTSVPKSDASALFHFDGLGNPVMPLELAAKDTPSSYGPIKDLSDWIKEASSHFGDGKIIGQHWGKMDKWERANWINAFQAGNFKQMYQIEVQAAAAEGKAHNAGYLHPGFPDNTETHQVKWAAAVPGEVSALDKIPGQWSEYMNDASMPEIENYLIKAQMQNPMHLSNVEKRQWYSWHRASAKILVDKLSAVAALRAKNGETPLSPAPVWTDDIKPAKSYDKLFEADPLPTEGWSGSSAQTYLQDHPEIADLQALHKKYGQEYGPNGAATNAVKDYFQSQKDAHAAELAKVFYKKSPTQKVEKGTHPIYEYDDYNGLGQIGNHYFFKPSPQGDAYRSDAEHLGHEFGWAFGFKTSGSELTTLDGKYGQLQKDLGSVGDLNGFDMGTLSANQIADIGKEHLLDWFLDNDDTHSANMQIMSDGSLVGIDKGRGFKHFGAWKGLDPNGMNSNAQTVYARLFKAIQNGQLSKEDVDKAYLQIQKRAVQMSKVDDQKIKDMLAKGMEKRKVWDIKYSIDGKAVPSNLAGLQAAVLDRKNKMPEQIQGMWAKIYKDAGFGDLPKPPPAKLGEEHYSGLDESHFHEAAFKVNAGGVSALMGGQHTTTGAAIAWGTTNKDGSKDMHTQMELNSVHDEKVLAKLQSMAPDAVAGAGSHKEFSNTEYGANYTEAYYRAMATLLKHSDDKGWNADRIAEYEAAKTKLEKDLAFWTPNPESNKDGNVKFPSGAEVPLEQIGQYKNMLEFYKGREQFLDGTLHSGAQFPASAKAKFEPYAIADKPKHYINSTNGSGESLVELKDGTYLHTTATGTSVMSKAQAESSVIGGQGWNDVTQVEDTSKPKFGGAALQLNNKTFETSGKWNTDNGQIETGTSGVGHWTQGSEYQVTLPTGEKIFFRNRSKTSTLHSQYGRLTIKVEGAKNSSDYAAGLQRANDWIQSYLGLDMSGAEENNAELTYWNQMVPTLTRRNLPSGSKYAKAFADIQKKASELGINTDTFQYQLGDHMSVDEQNAFYRKLWGDHFGKDKVDKLISSQGYLPKYEKTDIHSSDTVHGRPVWHRLDLSLKELLAGDKNAFAASHNTSGSDALKNVGASGVHLSTEERIRFFGGTSGSSSGSDQQMGTGGQDQFLRVWNSPSANGYDYVYHPSVMLHTNTRFFHNDAFGADSNEKGNANPDPMNAWTKHQSNSGSAGGGNQLDVRWASSLMGTLEMVLFDNAADRDYAIQKMKKAGLDMIRGLPVEDRLVMRVKREQAIEKLKAQWQIEAEMM